MNELSRILYAAIKYFLLLILMFISFFLLLYLGFPYIFMFFYDFSEKEKAVENGRVLTETSDTIAVVGAHPDDIEWWAGGSLLKAKKNGSKVILIIATDSMKNGKLRRKEQMRAAKILGYDRVYFLGYPDGRLSEIDEGEVAAKILEIFEVERPKTVLTFDVEKPSKIYKHKDHLAAGKAAIAAAKSSNAKRIYLFHTSSPNAVVDITPFVSEKLKAFASHESQQGGLISKIFNLLVREKELTPATFQLRRMSKMFGMAYGFKYAETFRMTE